MVYAALIETNEAGISLMANRDGSVAGFESRDDGLRYFEDGYSKCHARNYTWSMSAVINAITYRPSIVSFESFEELVKEVLDGNTEASLIRMTNVAGTMIAVRIPNQAKAKELWEAGSRPAITGGMHE